MRIQGLGLLLYGPLHIMRPQTTGDYEDQFGFGIGLRGLGYELEGSELLLYRRPCQSSPLRFWVKVG